MVGAPPRHRRSPLRGRGAFLTVLVANVSEATGDTNITTGVRLVKRPMSLGVALPAGKATSTGLPVARGRSSPGFSTARITPNSTGSLQPGPGQVMIEVPW